VAKSRKGLDQPSSIVFRHLLINTYNSIVFSSWRAPLEIIAEILQEKQIKFLKIDGSVGNAKRSDRLAQFRTLADVSVLLMTLQTGAVG
jgi:SNF2 family DNA or RNA helicase